MPSPRNGLFSWINSIKTSLFPSNGAFSWTKQSKTMRDTSYSVMLNEVKRLYNKDSSLTLRMTVSVIIYIVTIF